MITHEFCRLSGSELIRQFYDPRIVPFSFQTVACLNESGGKNKKILQREKYTRIKCVLRVKESDCVIFTPRKKCALLIPAKSRLFCVGDFLATSRVSLVLPSLRKNKGQLAV